MFFLLVAELCWEHHLKMHICVYSVVLFCLCPTNSSHIGNPFTTCTRVSSHHNLTSWYRAVPPCSIDFVISLAYIYFPVFLILFNHVTRYILHVLIGTTHSPVLLRDVYVHEWIINNKSSSLLTIYENNNRQRNIVKEIDAWEMKIIGNTERRWDGLWQIIVKRVNPWVWLN